jgi:hypothetical protein
MQLHEFHARSLESSIGIADEAARRMERLLLEGGQEALVRPIVNSLSAETREKLMAQVRELRAMLNEIVERFSLTAHPLDLRQVLAAEVSALWVIFEDCMPARMRGYGQEFSPDAKAALENLVDRLAKHTFAMGANLH